MMILFNMTQIMLCTKVEYSYPPLIPGNTVDSGKVPPEWKHLASLALPDGAHNFLSGM